VNRLPLGAVVLAAGRSTRMGRDKALLPLGNATALERVVAACRAGGAEGVVVVVSPTGDAVREAALALDARVAVTADQTAGPIASLKAGIREVPGDPAGVLVFPVDHPLVAGTTVMALVAALFRDRSRQVLFPRHEGRRGHPVLLGHDVLDEVLALPRESTLRAVTFRDEARNADVEVADPWVSCDLDTPEDYQQALRSVT
jgi:molybdenum cofactor cytidylyltransferase